MDSQYESLSYGLNEIEHHYGEQVHILSDPFALTQLARLCSPQVGQPTFNRLIQTLYRRLLIEVINREFPRREASIDSRMKESTERGVFAGEVIDEGTEVVTVDIARAGILPSHACYTCLNELIEPANVRQDHLIMSRVTNRDDEVVGAEVSGEKVGGPVDGRIVLFPDPMGATGSSMSTALEFYKETSGGEPLRLITLNLICTPEFITRMKNDHPEAQLYALRLDRGMSTPEALASVPGQLIDQESGLNDKDYIVPGGGGFGELMNNAWV